MLVYYRVLDARRQRHKRFSGRFLGGNEPLLERRALQHGRYRLCGDATHLGGRILHHGEHERAGIIGATTAIRALPVPLSVRLGNQACPARL